MTHRLGMTAWLAENDGIPHAIHHMFDLSEYEAQAAEIGETTMKHAQQYRIDAAVLRSMTPFREVPAPVDVTDAAAFPEIARAIAHAKALREGGA